MITLKINCSRIAKEHLYAGKNGKYLDLALFENRDGIDQYGNDGFVTQSVGKDARERGEKGPIIGNWKRLEKRAQQPSRPAAKPQKPADPLNGAPGRDGGPIDDDDVPF